MKNDINNFMNVERVAGPILMRSDFDEDIYHIGYTWKMPGGGKSAKRLACTIHIDDIGGVFGETVYNMAIDIEPGGWDWLP